MDGEFRFGEILILFAAVFILILLVDVLLRERRKIKEAQQPEAVPTDTKLTEHVEQTAEDLLIVHVIAKNGGYFAAYDLLQAISTTGMQYGPMNIFHYYDEASSGKVSLFNLASATEPGEFDLDHMGDFSCAGLTLFMNMRQVPDPMEAFEIMLVTAEQLADDLEGDLCAAHRMPWNEEIMKYYQDKIMNYQNRV